MRRRVAVSLLAALLCLLLAYSHIPNGRKARRQILILMWTKFFGGEFSQKYVA